MASTVTETHLTQSEPDPDSRAASPTVLAILFAISFSHLLNDTIQSLIPAIYPLLKTSFPPQLRAGRPYHARLPDDRFDPAAVRRLVYRSAAQALLARLRNGSSPWAAWFCSPTPPTTRWWWEQPRSSAWARRFSTRNPPASLISLPAAGMALRNRFSKSAGTPGVR